MEIANHRRKMLNAMESNAKGNNNFATKVISTENVVKNVEEVKRKNQTYFFSKLLTWTTSLKVTLSGNYYIFKILTSNVQITISLNKGSSSSSRAMYKFILHVIQNLCNGQDF